LSEAEAIRAVDSVKPKKFIRHVFVQFGKQHIETNSHQVLHYIRNFSLLAMLFCSLYYHRRIVIYRLFSSHTGAKSLWRYCSKRSHLHWKL